MCLSSSPAPNGAPPPPEAPPIRRSPAQPATCRMRSSSLVACGWLLRLASSSRMLSSFCPRRRARSISTLCTFTRSKTYFRSFSRATWVGKGTAHAWVRTGPRSPRAAGLEGRDPEERDLALPATGSAALFSGGGEGLHWLGEAKGSLLPPYLHGAAAVRQPHGHVLPASLGNGPLVILWSGGG